MIDRAPVPAANGPAPFPSAWWFPIASALALVLLFAGSIWAPLAEPDEPRYAEIPREMLVRHDWVTPHLNFVKYFEKPPLVYWATAAAYRLFGIGDAVARLPVVLSALLTLLAVHAFARRRYGSATATLAVFILATAPLFCAMGQVLTLDLPLTCCVTVALTAFWHGHREASRGWLRVAYVATALGILTKGPVAVVLVGGAAGLTLLAQRDWRGLWRAVDPLGLVLATAIVVPWFWLVNLRNPEFWDFFVVDQHLRRYVSTDEHRQPFWLFFALFPVVFAPWGFLGILDPSLWRARLDPRRWSRTAQFLALWTGFVLAFFSCSVSKLVTYILPAMPPAAILLARILLRAMADDRTTFLRRGAMLLLLLGIATSLGVTLAAPFVTHWRFAHLQPFLLGGGMILALTGLGMRAALVANRADRALLAMIAGTLGFFALCMSGRGVVNQYRTLGLAVRRLVRPDDRLAQYAHYVQGITFYGRRRAVLVRARGELAFGIRQLPPDEQREFFWEDDARLFEEWRRPQRLFVVINRKELEPIRSRLIPPPIEVAVQGKKVLIVNRAPHD